MSKIVTNTIEGLTDSNLLSVPRELTVGTAAATLNFGNTTVTNASAGSTTITAEGGSNTTNIQQGLAKVWADVDAGQGSYGDSFGFSSIDDDATGEATLHHTTNMSSANYSATTSVTFNHDGTGGHRDTNIRAKGTSATVVEFIFADTSGRGTQLDLETDASITIHGDLT